MGVPGGGGSGDDRLGGRQVAKQSVGQNGDPLVMVNVMYQFEPTAKPAMSTGLLIPKFLWGQICATGPVKAFNIVKTFSTTQSGNEQVT